MHILTRQQGKLNFDLFKKLVDDVHRKTPAILLYFQGEPYMNPAFFEMVSYARSRKMFVSTSTNAHYLSQTNCRKTIESGLSKLVVSVDGTTQDVYEAYRRGGNLALVLEGIERLVKTKKELQARYPVIELQFIVFRHNEHQVNDIHKLSRQLGVDRLVLKSAQVYNFEKEKNIIPENPKYSRYKKLPNGSYSFKSHQYNHCWKSWQSPVITWDGDVVPCCYDKNADHKAGNISNNTFKDAWKTEDLKSFFNRILADRNQNDICRNCPEGTGFLF